MSLPSRIQGQAAIDQPGVRQNGELTPSPPAHPQPSLCGNPHHTLLINSLKRHLVQYKVRVGSLTAEKAREKARARAEIARLQHMVGQLLTKDVGRVSEIERLKAEKIALQDKLNGRGKQKTRTWPEKLKAFVDDGKRLPTYDAIYTLSCKEENMSTSTQYTHPLIRLSRSSNEWRLEEANDQDMEARVQTRSFLELPANVQARIFQLCLHKDRPIHCFSRLDPFTPPNQWPATKSASGLFNCFYWGDERSVNLTEDTVDPQEALALFLVCKDFYLNGVHAFYGLNTFAFSSIGEFGRFGKGIGQARAAVIQHVDLTWIGSQYLTAQRTFSLNKKGKQVENWDSVRTRPLTLFLNLPRLRTLAIFLVETGHLCERRQYESPEVKAKLLDETADQPNFRQNRSMRNLQGGDYLYALRGLDWVQVYDLGPTIKDVNSPVPIIRPIRDRSFLVQLNDTVTEKKLEKQADKAKLENLPRLFERQDAAGAQPVNVVPLRQHRVEGHPGSALLLHRLELTKSWDRITEPLAVVQMFYTETTRRGLSHNTLTETFYGANVAPVVEQIEVNCEAGNVSASADRPGPPAGPVQPATREHQAAAQADPAAPNADVADFADTNVTVVDSDDGSQGTKTSEAAGYSGSDGANGEAGAVNLTPQSAATLDKSTMDLDQGQEVDANEVGKGEPAEARDGSVMDLKFILNPGYAAEANKKTANANRVHHPGDATVPINPSHPDRAGLSQNQNSTAISRQSAGQYDPASSKQADKMKDNIIVIDDDSQTEDDQPLPPRRRSKQCNKPQGLNTPPESPHVESISAVSRCANADPNAGSSTATKRPFEFGDEPSIKRPRVKPGPCPAGRTAIDPRPALTTPPNSLRQPRPPTRSTPTPLRPLQHESAQRRPATRAPVQSASPDREQNIRSTLGEYVNCPAIATLVKPFTDTLVPDDWRLVSHILNEHPDLRVNSRAFRNRVDREGLRGNEHAAERILMALGRRK